MNARDQARAARLLQKWEDFGTDLIKEKNPTSGRKYQQDFLTLLADTHAFLNLSNVELVPSVHTPDPSKPKGH